MNVTLSDYLITFDNVLEKIYAMIEQKSPDVN